MQSDSTTHTATHDHPNILGAYATLRSIRQAMRYVPDALEPVREYRSEQAPTRNATARRLAAAKLLKAERADRTYLTQQGLAPDVPVSAPTNLAVVAAADAAQDTAVDCAWIVASHLRLRPLLVYGLAWQYPYHSIWDAATGYLRTGLAFVTPGVAAEVEQALHHADTILRTAMGVGSDRLPVHATCPACGWRRLTAEVSSPERAHWTVTCEHPTCRCQGRDCRCKQPARTPGTRHVWPASAWGQLERLLGRVGTGVAA